jgi:hypothetical protein
MSTKWCPLQPIDVVPHAALQSEARPEPLATTWEEKVADDRTNNATYRTIERLVRSAEGIMLAVQATNMDRPALCGVDVLLRMELGADYARASHGTWYAGYAVAELMREMGYRQAGTAKCSPDCVAGQGIVWKTKDVQKNNDYD